jgi:hypothetical protein
MNSRHPHFSQDIPVSQHQTPPQRDGSWLCSEGSYRDLVKKMCALDPGLAIRDPKNRRVHWPAPNAQVVLLEVKDCSIERHNIDFVQASQLRTRLDHLHSLVGKGPYPRIYLVEGLTPDFISVLGTEFNIDPSFFVGHERTIIWNILHDGINDNLPPPSMLAPKKIFQIRYYEVAHFLPGFLNFGAACGATGRHIGVTRLSGRFSSSGIVRRKYSF